MAEKKMEEKVDYTVPDFDIDNTETPGSTKRRGYYKKP